MPRLNLLCVSNAFSVPRSEGRGCRSKHTTKGNLSLCQNVQILRLLLMVAIPVPAQTPSSEYQAAIITDVTVHTNGPQDRNDNVKQYDVSVKVGNTSYVVLYTQPPGRYGVQFATGQSILVSVGQNDLTFNDVYGKPTAAPTLRRRTLPAMDGID